jgi:predicted GIY-YIG superfamily endonuclease
MSYYIYKICCDDCPDFVYVGSTKAFRQRKAQHKQIVIMKIVKRIIVNYIQQLEIMVVGIIGVWL